MRFWLHVSNYEWLLDLYGNMLHYNVVKLKGLQNQVGDQNDGFADQKEILWRIYFPGGIPILRTSACADNGSDSNWA